MSNHTIQQAIYTRKKITIYDCPLCASDLNFIELIDCITTLGARLGRTYFECKGGCTQRGIYNYQLKTGAIEKVRARLTPLSDKQFLEMIFTARKRRKKINNADKDRESQLFKNRPDFYNQVYQNVRTRW